jgi:hypothetical protein
LQPGCVRAVEDQVQAEGEVGDAVVVAFHDVDGQLDQVGVLAGGQLRQVGLRYLWVLLRLEGVVEFLEREPVDVAVHGVPGVVGQLDR